MYPFLSSSPPALPSPPHALTSCTYSLPAYHSYPSEWYARHAASACSYVTSLSPFISAPPSSIEAVLLSGYLQLPADGIYEFSVTFSHRLRVYLGDAAAPCFVAVADAARSQTFALFLARGDQYLHIVWERREGLLEMHFRPSGATQWSEINETVLRAGAAFPTTLAMASVMALTREPVTSAAPRVGGAFCEKFDVQPSLPETLVFDGKTGIIRGTLEVATGRESHR